jgi:hypothetical protein
VPEYPLGRGLHHGQVRTWAKVAQDTLGFLESIVREPSRSRWRAREHAVGQILAAQA